MKDKWKTHPCKNCLLKSKREHQCFEFPSISEIVIHINQYNLQHICLCCGNDKELRTAIRDVLCYKCSENPELKHDVLKSILYKR